MENPRLRTGCARGRRCYGGFQQRGEAAASAPLMKPADRSLTASSYYGCDRRSGRSCHAASAAPGICIGRHANPVRALERFGLPRTRSSQTDGRSTRGGSIESEGGAGLSSVAALIRFPSLDCLILLMQAKIYFRTCGAEKCVTPLWAVGQANV